MQETFLALFLFFHKNPKSTSEHKNPLKNKFKHLFEAKFGTTRNLLIHDEFLATFSKTIINRQDL